MRNKWFKKRYDRQDLQQGTDLCQRCHRTIHKLVPNEKELGRHYNTTEALLEHAKLAKYVDWKRRKDEGEKIG